MLEIVDSDECDVRKILLNQKPIGLLVNDEESGLVIHCICNDSQVLRQIADELDELSSK